MIDGVRVQALARYLADVGSKLADEKRDEESREAAAWLRAVVNRDEFRDLALWVIEQGS